METEVLVSTMNLKSQQELVKKLNVKKNVIINQTSDINNVKDVIYGKNRLYSYNERGLSKSRNKAIMNSNADICIIADDDLKYESDYEEKIKNGYKKYKDAGIIAFYVDNVDKKFEKKKRKEGKINLITSMKIQSVHIRNYRKLKNCHIDFDKEETVFVGANNSGKTSAISAIVWFFKNTEKFTLKEFTATNWALVNEIGDKWLEGDSVDEALLSSHQWDDIVPSMDVWISVEDGEQYRVNHLIPSLSTWDGKKVGVRGQYEPKDVKKLYTASKEPKMKL